MKMRIAGVMCTLLLLCPVVSQGEVWNLADDFSATQNPNGAWSYGWRPSAEEPLTLYTDHDYFCSDLEPWVKYFEVWCPNVIRNPHDYPITCQTFVIQPHKALFHPGPAQQSVVRWTAQSDDSVTVTAHFLSIDIGSKIVFILADGMELYEATLDGLGTTADYSGTIPVHAGSTVECAVSPISFYYDSTQIDFVVETTEPPVGACCFASGDCLLGTEAGCEGAGGTYLGDEVPCDPHPCESTPVRNTTWGEVKSLFR
jgi:hypothetical protein